jgi:hypothetical protein
MAAEVQIQPGSLEKTAKVRHPVAVVIFSIITFGIYYVYWWYQLNREMRDLGEARGLDGLGRRPVNSLLAVFPGAIIVVPPLVSYYNGVRRIQRAQEVTVGNVTMNGWAVVILLVISFVPFLGLFGIILPGYVQGEMNKVWETVGAQNSLEAPNGPPAPESPPADAGAVAAPATTEPPEPPAQI